MATSMEQVSQTGGWIDTYQRGQDAYLDAFPHQGFGASRPDCRPIQRGALLQSIVAAEILPRLARIGQEVSAIDGSAAALKKHASTQDFVHVLLTQEADRAVRFIETLREAGATPAALYLGIITEAARSMDELWQQDRCDFAQVTIGMGRLQLVLRALSPHFQMNAVRRAETESLLLMPAPGEQHTFGLVMLAEFFLREGWHVAGGPTTSGSQATEMVRRTWFDVAGFSIGSSARLEGLAQCIRAVRRASCNPNLCVMVGGPLFLVRADLVSLVGADFGATDAEGAVRQARGLSAAQAFVN